MMFGDGDDLKTDWTREVSGTDMVYTLTLSVAESTESGSPFKYTEKNESSGTLGKPTTEVAYNEMVTTIGSITNGINFTTTVEFIPY